MNEKRKERKIDKLIYVKNNYFNLDRNTWAIF